MHRHRVFAGCGSSSALDGGEHCCGCGFYDGASDRSGIVADWHGGGGGFGAQRQLNLTIVTLRMKEAVPPLVALLSMLPPPRKNGVVEKTMALRSPGQRAP